MIYRILDAFDRKLNFGRAQAHCDIPCGIYDPIGAQIAALTVVRMIDLMGDLMKNNPEPTPASMHSATRYIAVKEEHAEKVKHEIRVIWGDYFKPELLQKYPDLTPLVHRIMAEASKGRQTADREQAVKLVEDVNEFARIFWETKGVATKRAKAPYAPGLELVYPNL
jgi:nickel superoxide dismutase